jgi:hypothetical protein
MENAGQEESYDAMVSTTDELFDFCSWKAPGAEKPFAMETV